MEKITETIPDDAPLPLARMATISKPSFWIFIGICILLYIYNKAITPDFGEVNKYISNGNYVIGAAFAGLFLTLITGAVKNSKINHAFNVVCYVFEITSIAAITFLVIFK